MVTARFWEKRKVFLTGHTGFKGSWLSLWLHSLGAKVTGYALPPPTEPNLFSLAHVQEVVDSHIADIREGKKLLHIMQEAQPEVVIHMAAQPLVRDSYKIPVDTYDINVMGTVHLLEAVRATPSVRAVINVTTDKVYENLGKNIPFKENDPFGGYDPYSNSKACSELVTTAYRNSYFNPQNYTTHRVALASARAGNVIGGGDWAGDRLVPDFIRSIVGKKTVVLRKPHAVRPWQHVLEPLSGYLLLAEQLIGEKASTYARGWNFGPSEQDVVSVETLVRTLCEQWGEGASYSVDTSAQPHEAHFLTLDSSDARETLHWHPRWNLTRALEEIVSWTKAYVQGRDMRLVCKEQIARHTESTPLD